MGALRGSGSGKRMNSETVYYCCSIALVGNNILLSFRVVEKNQIDLVRMRLQVGEKCNFENKEVSVDSPNKGK
jgi:hypothetical protein